MELIDYVKIEQQSSINFILRNRNMNYSIHSLWFQPLNKRIKKK